MILTKLTLIWVTKPDKPFRIISIPKHWFFIVLGGFGFLLLCSLALFYAAESYTAQHISDRLENRRLRQMLSQKETFYQDERNQKEHMIRTQAEEISKKGEALSALQQQLNGLMDQLYQIRSSETKIRRFLGLDDKAADAKHPNQGGVGLSELPPGTYGDPAALPATKELFRSDAAGASNELKNSVQELLDYLEQKHEEISKLPTILPVSSNDLWVSCGFGWRSNPFTGKGRELHLGLDIAGPFKSRVIAPADGEVIEAGEDRFLGNCVRIRHSKHLTTIFGHLQSIAVSVGDKVKREDLIGYMGNTGRSTGVHLHYSIMKDGKYVDPVGFIWDRELPTLALGN